MLVALAATGAHAADPVVVELPIDGPVRPSAIDAVGLGVHPRDAHSFRSLATERLVRIFVAESIAFEVISEGAVLNELHEIRSPAGTPAVRFVAGRADVADFRLGDDGAGGALVAIAGNPGSLVGVARRPGIVTVDDVVATVARRVGLDRGDPLRVGSSTDLATLRARLTRDRGVGVGLSTSSVLMAFGLVALGGLARRARNTDLAERLAGAAMLVPFGYLLGLFVPSGSWFIRSIPVLLTPLALLGPKIRLDVAALGAAGLIAVLTIAAALNPSGEPGLSLWGNPFESVRFFGLRNHLEAFLAGSVILWLGMARPRAQISIGVGLAAAVIVGAPWLGANFGGVLTLVFGVALVVLLCRGWRFGVRPVAAALGFAVVAMTLALLSDTGQPISHGGRAVRSAAAEGPGAVVDILQHRARLNWREVTDRDVVGFLGAAIIIAALSMLLVWAVRRLRKDPFSPHGIAVCATAATAVLALISEDSGFMTGGILGLYPAVVWLRAPVPRALLPVTVRRAAP